MKPYNAPFALALLVGGCSPDSPAKSTTGTGGSGGATSSATIASATTATSSTSTGAGGASAGSGGGTSSGGAGAVPDWAPFGTIAGCAVERLANPAAVRAFSWANCPGMDGCEELRFEPWLAEDPSDPVKTVNPNPGSMISESPSGLHVALILGIHGGQVESTAALFTREDGWVAEGYRVPGENGCNMQVVALDALRYGLALYQPGPTFAAKVGGVLGTLGGGDAPVPFDVVPAPVGYGPFPTTLGPSRWLWRYNPPMLISLSSTDGSDVLTLAKFNSAGPTFGLSVLPTSTGATFIFGEEVTTDGVTTMGRLVQTDGVGALQPYIEPADGSYLGNPRFAGSHIAWSRGTGQIGGNKFAAVEVWASPFSEDPTQLAPYKVADYPVTSLAELNVGGHGYCATWSLTDNPIELASTAALYNLKTKERTLITIPEQRRIFYFMGISISHMWLGGVKDYPNPVDRIYRFALPT